MKAGTHLPSPTGSHTAAYTAKHGAFWMGALSLPSDRFARFGNPARPGIRTANFAAFGSWSGVLPKSAESLRNSDALMRVAVPRRRGPAGLRDLFCFCRNQDLYIRRSWFSACARQGWYHYSRRAPHAAETPGPRLSTRLTCRFLRSCSHQGISPRPLLWFKMSGSCVRFFHGVGRLYNIALRSGKEGRRQGILLFRAAVHGYFSATLR